MQTPVRLIPDAWYDDAVLRRDLSITADALGRARKAGELRFTRRGGKCRYLGQWVCDWLIGEPAMTAAVPA